MIPAQKPHLPRQPEQFRVPVPHRLMWAQSTGTVRRAVCFLCGEELERQHTLGWVEKKTGSPHCLSRLRP